MEQITQVVQYLSEILEYDMSYVNARRENKISLRKILPNFHYLL